MDVATEFAEAVAAKDGERLAALFAPGVDFRALTPNRNWQASEAGEIVEIVFGSWFEPKDEIDEILSVETGSIADRDWFAYRLRGHNPDGPFEVEQNAYLSAQDGTIEWMRVLCSGFRPSAPG